MAEKGILSPPAAPYSSEAACVAVDHADPGCFAQLLQSEFFLAVDDACPVRVFLHGVMGLDDDYIANRLQTVFLNGLAVDDLDTAVVRPGSRLALSAALPGLVGATMRRGGAFASLRQSVTHTPEHVISPSGPFLAEVRLFNLIGDDLAARLLARGVLLKTETLVEFLRSRPEPFWASLRALALGPKTLDRDGVHQDIWPESDSLLRLTMAGAARET